VRAHRPIADLFKWALVVSTVFHLCVVLGISFVLPEPVENRLPERPMKITLVPHVSAVEPEEYDTLAQANSLAEEESGTVIPDTLFPGPVSAEEILRPPPARPLDQMMHRDSDEPGLLQTAREPETGKPGPSREQLVQEISLAYSDAQSKPRRKYVGARTKESAYAAYIEKWRQRVERVGNLNYPEAAKSQKLEGSLVLEVAINAEGAVEDVRVLSSSGLKILDDAALKTVDLAAPFDRFPDTIRVETDVLHIVRTWEYMHDNLTSSTIRGSE